MGRRQLNEEEKRKLLSARFDPGVAKSLEAHAKDSGRSIPAEIEARIEATIALDKEGIDLVAQISSEMDAIRRRNKGNRWHKDLTTWAATVEMMAIGPIQDVKPLHPVDAEAQEQAWSPLAEIYERQHSIVKQLAVLGIHVSHNRLIRGLLRLNSRNLEKAAIEAIEGKEDRDVAAELHQRLCALDDAQDAAMAEYELAMGPYREAEREGRELYREHLHSKARQARDEGGSFNIRHLLKVFSQWL